MLNQSMNCLGAWKIYMKIEYHKPTRFSVLELCGVKLPMLKNTQVSPPRTPETLLLDKWFGPKRTTGSKVTNFVPEGSHFCTQNTHTHFAVEFLLARMSFRGISEIQEWLHTPHTSAIARWALFHNWSQIDFSHWRTYLRMGWIQTEIEHHC